MTGDILQNGHHRTEFSSIVPLDGNGWSYPHKGVDISFGWATPALGAPQNGVIARVVGNYNNYGVWEGNLFIPDNGTDGLYYGGFSDSVFQGWRRLVEISGSTPHSFTLDKRFTIFYYYGSGSQLITLDRPVPNWYYAVISDTGEGRYPLGCRVHNGTQLEVWCPGSGVAWCAIGIGN